MKTISYSELPDEAQALISDEQRTFIDEFTFVWNDGLIEAWYAEEILAVFDGHGWQ